MAHWADVAIDVRRGFCGYQNRVGRIWSARQPEGHQSATDGLRKIAKRHYFDPFDKVYASKAPDNDNS